MGHLGGGTGWDVAARTWETVGWNEAGQDAAGQTRQGRVLQVTHCGVALTGVPLGRAV